MAKTELEQLRKENEELKRELESLKNLREHQKQGMIKKASEGKIVTRAPWGYAYEGKKLVPGEHSFQVEDLFQEFLKNKISLTKISKKYGFSVNGIKKILSNFTYIGKVKFNNQIHEGKHKPIISSTLFNHVQNKLEDLGIKKI